MNIDMIKNTRNNNNIWFTAIVNNDIELWNKWVKEIPDVNKITDATGQSPLHWSCFLKNKEITQDLLERGANPWQLDNEMVFPWKLAMKHDYDNEWNWHIWPYYYKQFSIDMKTNYLLKKELIKTLTAFSLKREYHKIKAVIQHFKPDDLNNFYLNSTTTTQRLSPLHLAFALKDFELFEIFFQWGIDINSVDDKNNTTLFFAIACNQSEWVEFLLNKNATFPTLIKDNIEVANLGFSASPQILTLLNNHIYLKNNNAIPFSTFMENLMNKHASIDIKSFINNSKH